MSLADDAATPTANKANMIPRPAPELYRAFDTPRPKGVTSVFYALDKIGSKSLIESWPKSGKPTNYPIEVSCFLIDEKGLLATGKAHTVDDEHYDRLTWDKLAYASACANLAELRNNTKE